ncbi:hypothetical protein GCM10010503_40570 [Streptomyces lucensis JCM 4490]|uniref:Uncharacterized protein n=1 Tax=Streptomyces lucensis JCM 4490 TaxID=1306176 RepID=A0A918MRJ5_9ACTN|nr:hypothetical protein GCM10010503_40570 [Streptomyces lucensis JCM 4490]
MVEGGVTVVLWHTRYLEGAVDSVRAGCRDIGEEDVTPPGPSGSDAAVDA